MLLKTRQRSCVVNRNVCNVALSQVVDLKTDPVKQKYKTLLLLIGPALRNAEIENVADKLYVKFERMDVVRFRMKQGVTVNRR